MHSPSRPQARPTESHLLDSNPQKCQDCSRLAGGNSISERVTSRCCVTKVNVSYGGGNVIYLISRYCNYTSYMLLCKNVQHAPFSKQFILNYFWRSSDKYGSGNVSTLPVISSIVQIIYTHSTQLKQHKIVFLSLLVC